MKRLVLHLKDRVYVTSLITSFVYLFSSFIINFFAGTFATEDASNSVTDIILSNIPVFDVDGVFVWGAFILVACITLVCFAHPQKIPFIVKSISLFVVIRAIFINLTHLAPFPSHVIVDPLSYANYFMFGGDLFFSGHTGLPFLIALIFWNNKILRYSFISFSVLLGTISLMGHLHYSIDIFAAFFITFAIYHIAVQLFKNDKIMADKEHVN